MRAGLSKIRDSKYVSSILLMASGTLIGQIMVIGVSPILTRIYTPTDFGLFATYTSVILILNVVSSLKYELAIPLSEDDSESASIFLLALIVLTFFSMLAWVGIQLAPERYLQQFNILFLKRHSWLIPLSLILNGLYQTLNYWVVRDKEFRVVAKTKASQGVSLALSQPILGLTQINHLGLIFGDILSRASGIYTLSIHVLKQHSSVFRTCNFQTIFSAGQKYKKFPLMSAVSAAINSCGAYLPAIFISGLYGDTAVGNFALAQRIITLPMSLLGQSISSVYLSEISRYAYENNGYQKIMILFKKSLKKTCFSTIIPAVLFAIVSPYLFKLIFGEDWVYAGDFVRILAIPYCIHLCVAPLSQTLNVISRQDTQLFWDAARLALVLLGFFLCNHYNLDLQSAMCIYSAVLCISYGSLTLLIYWKLKEKVSSSNQTQ